MCVGLLDCSSGLGGSVLPEHNQQRAKRASASKWSSSMAHCLTIPSHSVTCVAAACCHVLVFCLLACLLLLCSCCQPGSLPA